MDYKKYLNKVVRINGQMPAYLYDIREHAGSFILSLITITSDCITRYSDRITEIKSVRGISPELRLSLKEAGKAQKEMKKFQESVKIKQTELIANINKTLSKVKETTNVLSTVAFANKLCDFLNENYCKNRDCLWECNSYYSNEPKFVLSCTKYCEKWADYSFIITRYDDTHYIDDDMKSAKDYLKANAPAVNQKVKELFKCKISQELSLGDKRTLYASQNYHVKVKETTKTELDRIIKSLS